MSKTPLMTPYPLWLWQNVTDQRNGVISWCSTEQYGQFNATLTCLDEHFTPAFISQCRDHSASVSLQALVGADIAKHIITWLTKYYQQNETYLQIHLLSSLPKQWQALPLEWCQYQGCALHHWVQIIRHAPPPKKALVRSVSKKITLLNLWPDNEYDQHFFAHLNQTIIKAGHINCLQEVTTGFSYYLKHNDLSATSMLCIISHGNEGNSNLPLCIKNGTPWKLPSIHLPPLVVLIACGGEQGNLKDYALKLLQDAPSLEQEATTAYGAATVLIAQGKINAAQAHEFIENFMIKWMQGESADTILYQLQRTGHSEHAAMRMQVIGQSHLGQYIQENTSSSLPLSWHELTHTATKDDTALITLLNVLTQHSLIKYSSAESLAEKLYQTLGYTYSTPDEPRDLLYDRLNRIYASCNALTQIWLSGFLMAQSAIYEHDNMARYEQEVFKYEAIALPGYADAHIPLYIAQAKYRERNHIKAVHALVAGFHSIANNNLYGSELEYRLSGLAVNLFVDLSFTDIASFFSTYTSRCIEKYLIDNGKQYAYQTFIHLDRTARLATRMGDPNGKGEAGLKRCIRLLDEKRYQAMHTFDDYDKGNRELSSLLTLSAWLEHPNKTYITDAVKALTNVNKISEDISHEKGNIGKLYLLKGLAHWAWRQNDHHATKLLEQYIPTLITLCLRPDKQDAGPLGSIMACMLLMEKQHQDNEAMHEAWDAISEKMHRQFYYFELTLFFSLLDEEEKSSENYQDFKTQQETVLQHLKQLDTTILGKNFNHLLQVTEEKLHSYYPLHSNGTKFSNEISNMKRYGLIPF